LQLFLTISRSHLSHLQIFADAGDASSALLATFSGELPRKKWLECCNNARLCCDKMLENTTAARE
jgi:hypothetical protein